MRKFSTLTWLLFLAFFSYGFTVFAIGPCLTSVREAYGLTREAFSIVFPTFAGMFVLGSLIGGFAGERFGSKTVLMVGLLIYAASLILFALAPRIGGFPLAVIAMGLNGVGGGLIELMVSTLAADIHPERQGMVLNALQVAFGVGAVSSPLIIAALFAHGLSWQILYYLGGGTSLIMFALLAMEDTPHHRPEEPITRAGVTAMMRSPGIWALVLAMMLYVGAEVSFADWQSDFLEKGLRASRMIASGVPSLFWLAMTLGRVFCSVRAGRLKSRQSLVVMGLGGAVAIATTSLAGSVPLAVLGIAAAGFMLAGSFGMVLTYATERFGLHNGPVFSLMIAGVGSGSAIFPALTGILADKSNIAAAMMLPAALLLAFGVLFLLIHRLPDHAWTRYLATRAEAAAK